MGKIVTVITIDALKDLGFELPDTCPICGRLINPKPLLINEVGYIDDPYGPKVDEIVAMCPSPYCSSLYISRIKTWNDNFHDDIKELVYQVPLSELTEEFPSEISDLSSGFIELYNQAYSAEQKGLTMICGAGYRKSLEFLIKDFAIHLHPLEQEMIIKRPLKQCINEYIESKKIKTVADRAVFLGNDETHYNKKWEHHDLIDLKKLIKLTVTFISYEIQSASYEESMPHK